MTTTNPPEGPNRVEREIREILERADANVAPVADFQAAVRRRQAKARAQLQSASPPRWVPHWSSEIVRLGAALLLAIAAALVANISHLLAVSLAIASGIALFSLWFRTGPTGPSDQPRWRGQDLRGPRAPTPFDSGERPTWRWPRRPDN